MKTGAINYNNSINFKSNLTPQLMRTIKNVAPEAIEDAFVRNYGIDLKCHSNKFFAFCFARTLGIFETLSEKFKLPFQALPPTIRVFSENSVICKKDFLGSSCILDSGYVLKKEPPFELRSILVQDKSATRVNREINQVFKAHGRSASHFLGDIVHEWLHNVHFDLIYKKYGYDGESLLGKGLYPAQNPTGKRVMKRYDKYKPDKQRRRQIYETLGAYSARSHSKLEIFAEGLTKVITETLDENLNITKNPLDGIVTFPKFLKKFIESQLE